MGLRDCGLEYHIYNGEEIEKGHENGHSKYQKELPSIDVSTFLQDDACKASYYDATDTMNNRHNVQDLHIFITKLCIYRIILRIRAIALE